MKNIEILVAEDSPTQAEQVKNIIERHGYQVTLAQNGQHALDLIIKQKPILVISDIVMPIMDGYQLCHKIKSDDNLRDIPVLLLTSLSDPKDIIRGLKCGADNFITKPFDEEMLISRLKYMLINKEMRKSGRIQFGVEIAFGDETYLVTPERQQILDMLISSYEVAVQKNLELIKVQAELRELNESLEDKVEERTTELTAEIAERKRAEEALRVSEEGYRYLFESNPLPMWIYDIKTLKFLAVNYAAINHYGYSRDEFLALTIKDIRPPEDVPVLLEHISKTRTAIDKAIVWKHRKKDGTIIDVEITSHELIFDAKPSRVILANDITERKKAEEAIFRLNETLEQRVIDRTAQLEAATRRESLMIENALDVICTIDSEGKFASVSPASVKIWGYKPEELIGQRYIDFVVPEDVQKTSECARNVMSGMVTTDFENCYQHKDGSFVNTLWAAYWSDKEQLMFCIARDITERKRIEKELKRREEQLNEAQRIAKVGSWEWDIEKDKISWSDELYRLFGFEPQECELTFETYLKHVHPEDREMVLNIVGTALQTHEFPTFDHRIVHPDGSIRICNSVGRVILDESGNPVKMTGIAQDITERKIAEDQIKQLNENLEKQALGLQTANKELEAFSYSVSHDLRSPLRAIDGFSRILFEDYGDKLDDEGRRVLDVISNNAQRMGQLIDDLLAFSRLGRKHLETSVIDMSELARDACTQIELCPKTKIKIDQLPEAIGDRALIRQVFINLISNAVKYSGKKENAQVEVGGRSENGENIYYVRDHGAGFDMKYADKLFGVFQRLHSVEEFEGTGVGLAIVQRIVHRHGGRVWAEAEVGKGATFYFVLSQTSLNQGS